MLRVWMDPIEQSQLLAILHAVGPERCLEWGSGGSTQYYLRQCPFVREWVSVEHDERWVEEVRAAVQDPRLRLTHVAPDRPLSLANPSEVEIQRWNLRAEYDPTLMVSYVSKPRSFGGSFDFVLVDGRARRFCIREGFSLLRPGGVLALHDAQREEYHDALHAVGTPLFLTPWKQGQMCLVRKP